MDIDNKHKEILTKEFDYAYEKMKTAADPEEILYYYTAFYNMINRIYNIQFSEDLLFAFFTMENAYKYMSERVHLIKSGQGPIGFDERFGVKFLEIIKKLKDGFFHKTKRLTALQELVTLAYTTTGNGYYLTGKGEINIFKGMKKITEKS